METLSLHQAICIGISRINNPRFTTGLNTGRLTYDLTLPTNYSGAIAFLEDGGNYELVKYSAPNDQAPDLTFDQLWDCVKKNYGLTAFSAMTGIGGIPINKLKLGHFVLQGSSKYTNLVSHFGTKFFPMARIPSSMTMVAKSLFGTTRIFGILGRSIPYVAIGFAVYDIVSIGLCALKDQNG